MTFEEIATDLEQTVAAAVPLLRAIDEAEAGRTPAPGKWSKKEILGHLLDSASNNHQRFIRLQFEPWLTFPGYQQNNWVEASAYGTRGWGDLVDLWSAYNRHVAHVIRHAGLEAAKHIWHYPLGDMTLEFLMSDYVGHIHHHLRQIVPQGNWRAWDATPWI